MSGPFEVLSPNTGKRFALWYPDDEQDLSRALGSIEDDRQALAKDVGLRRKLLACCIEGLKGDRSGLAEFVVREVGKKPAEANAEVDYAVSFLEHCMDLLDSRRFTRCAGEGRTVADVGIGGALLICPFNDPLAGLTRKIAPAIAAGCPVIVKPSSLGVLCARRMQRAFRRSGVDRAIHIFAARDHSLVEKALNHDGIDVVSFTGSTSVGRRIAVAAMGSGRKVVMELGGNCPFVVFEDADLERAANDLVERKLKAAGQACSSVNRVFVERKVHGRFRDMLADRAGGTTLGPSDSGADLGPVRTREAVGSLVELTERALGDGERLLTGLPVRAVKGTPFLFPFTILESDPVSLFDRHETFGPLLSIRPFADRDELFTGLARERHALAAYFYTGEPERIQERIQQLRFGSMGLNSTSIQGPDVPTGGFRDAGIGREGGFWGMNEYLTTVNMKQATD